MQARAHPNVLKASAWLNNLYNVKSGKKLEGVDLSVPLSYADRFRIRHPGVDWSNFPPHVDGTSPHHIHDPDTELSLGGAIERWEDETFRRCFKDILTGNWRQHDPYELEHRLDARSSLYGRPGQATVFRTFQGWLAMRFVGIDHRRHPPLTNPIINPLARQRQQREPSVSSLMSSCRTRIQFSVHSSAQPCLRIPPTSSTPRTGSLVCLFPCCSL